MTDNNTSDIHETQQLIVKLAHIAREIESRSMDALNRIEASTGAMQQGVQRLHGGAERFTQQAMQAISNGSQAAVAQGAQQALGQFNQQLQQSTSHALSAADTLREQSRTVSRAQRALVWKALIALAIGSLLAAGGSAYVAWNSMREVRQAEFGTAILRATQSGTLTVCGKEQVLCVKAGEKPRRAGARGEYLLVE
ncbi:hypothetical protein [Variovorax sp. Sphag1AA]|uniref:hypothetical protein n=1 Tax=Variovorax sp. Sphag1AA TaxID=2587027 RepID=UPI00160A3B40|nr:hypothetical protein [Variovorax sp. Sphag1AA]MBB3180273.1 putative phage infection (PIP) family protein YhgE [Variovorax sp. Sphag1AA]